MERPFGSMLFILCFGVLTAGVSLAEASRTLEQKLEEQNYRLGSEVEYAADYRMDDRVYVDSRRLILPAGDDRAFLVEFSLRCYGLHSNRLFARARKKGQLAPGDELLTKHEGRTVDHCEIKHVYLLEAL